ncbi:MAG: 23S rRNA (pseudouridine(1915)-N(3))-methyltransferase RlmH [Lachnospiraceae bacterium]|nr:23S rRNA (pseudouridine(1915)-N(3))-methyltransferase RlmH [Lachnospiraceae bacterium]
MNIEILCVGRIKEPYLKDAIGEYSKRLSKYCRLKITEVADEKTIDKQSEALDVQVRDKECERLMKAVRDNAYVIALAIEGESMDSVAFSELINDLAIRSVSDIQFVIGGSLGLGDAILKRADMKLSFSRMTFPHQLMRVILLEQIYRGYRIINHEPYHK